jgi:hypothetical protein
MVVTWWVAGLALVALFAPVVLFLGWEWRSRRDEVLAYFADKAIILYFKRFFSASVPESADAKRAFAEHHDRLFGRRHFVLPLLVLLAVSAVAIAWCADSYAQAAGDSGLFWRPLPPIPVSALFGAYAWVLYDFISQAVCRVLGPSNVLWATYRFAIAAPLAGAVASLFNEDLGVPLAFLLGSFPTHSLMLMMRRLANQKLGLGDQAEGRESELQLLDSLDRRTAERFAEENITCIVQLAYCNPVEVCIRTSIRLDVITDYVGQALLWNYLQEDTKLLRTIGIRGAPEIANLWDELNDTSPNAKALRETAEKTLAAAAKALKLEVETFRNTVAQIAEDPYTVFLCSIWVLGALPK